MVNPKIFKAYDIRGIYPSEIDEEAVEKIGQAFINFLVEKQEIVKKIVIGRDMRLSSSTLFKALVSGISAFDIEIIDIDVCSTPMFYFAIQQLGASGGMMITASHNPASYNGLKLCRENAISISGESGIYEIRDQINSIVSVTSNTNFKASLIKVNILDKYIDFILSKTQLNEIKPLKIVVDCGNGMVGPEIIKIAKKLSCQIIPLFCEPDGSFPNHEANPLKEENLTALKQKVLEEEADLGIAFDGDGDRVAFLDERGEVTRGDFITALLAKELLLEKPGQKILYEIRSSWIVREEIQKSGGIPVLSRAGHAPIKDKMRSENILFGGEFSGHYFFKDLGFVDNALMAMLKILEIISKENKSFSATLAPLNKYYASGEINFEIRDKDAKINELEKTYKNRAKNIMHLDGLTMEFDDWWFNLRPSNTEPVLRLNLEAKNLDSLKEKKEWLVNFLRS